MPSAVTTYTRRARTPNPFHQVDRRGESGFLMKSYFTANDDGDIIVEAGTVLAKLTGGINMASMTTSQPYYVPYSQTGAYGTGSDTAAGILDAPYDETYRSWQITPVTSGIVYEKYVTVPGGAIGDVPAAVKTDLSDIEFR